MGTLHNLDKGLRAVVATGLIDDFGRDPGFLNDRPASCLNMWEGADPASPAYMQSGYVSNTPSVGYIHPGFLYLGPGAHNVYVDVTNSPSSLGDQNYWCLQLKCDGPESTTFHNVQLEVSQRNSFVVYYAPGASFPVIYATGAGMAYDATERWYFKVTPGTSNASFLVQKSALDGSGLTTIMSGTTGSENPTGEFMELHSGPSVKYLEVGIIAAPAVIVPLNDLFIRADATPASAGPQGYTYSSPFGTTARINSNRLGGAAADWVAITAAGGATGDFDWTSTHVTGTPPSGATDYLDLYFRYVDANNRCFVEVSANNIALYTYVAGSLTSIASVAQSDYTGTAGQTHTIRVKGVGNTITVYLNDTLKITATVTALTSGVGTGIHQYSAGGYATMLRDTSLSNTHVDSFTRRDGSIVNMPDGTPYIVVTVGAHPPLVVSNQLKCTGATSSEGAELYIDLGSTAQTVDVDIITAVAYVDGVTYITAWLRWISNNDRLYIQFARTGAGVWSYAIYKTVAGVGTSLVSGTSGNSGTPTHLYATVSASGVISGTLTTSTGSVSVGPVTDNTRTGTKAGFETIATSVYDSLVISTP